MFTSSDLNDNVPVFDRTSYTAVVNENATVIYYLKPFYKSSILVSNFFFLFGRLRFTLENLPKSHGQIHLKMTTKRSEI